MSLRNDLADAIRAHADLPKGWTVYAWGHLPENPLSPFVSVRQTTVKPTPQAPRLYRETAFSVALVNPLTDPERVEDALDADVETLIDILDSLDFPGLRWEEAQRSMFEARFHGYDITVTITNGKDTP